MIQDLENTFWGLGLTHEIKIWKFIFVTYGLMSKFKPIRFGVIFMNWGMQFSC